MHIIEEYDRYHDGDYLDESEVIFTNTKTHEQRTARAEFAEDILYWLDVMYGQGVWTHDKEVTNG